jgi:hypothetical protein
METQMRENHKMISYIYIYIYIYIIPRKHQLPNSPAATERRLQPPIYRLQPEGRYNSLKVFGSNLKEDITPLFSGSNFKEDPTP